MSELRIERVYRRFWWPHIYAAERGLIWVKVVMGYRYFIGDREFDLARQRYL